jgi:hypothetical protein
LRGYHSLRKSNNASHFVENKIWIWTAQKINYVIVSRQQNAGENHSLPIDNKSFENVEKWEQQ